ncbi:Gfo/Idh/MocA family protein [Orenia marismortui]|uniref:Gfo/Idh/MocA family protein n=1 Tax=Orenia marismortui TaxID=46469 RepID=UPI00035D748B|nr:Gfo/Idh/MocA family oxidoreductase [Orenia marismortui]
MKKLRIGIVGCGLAWERLHYPAYEQLQDKYDIVSCSDVNLEQAIKATQMVNISQDKAYKDYREMINHENLDAVDITVPIPDNFSVSKDIAKTGIDIICEKPLATNLEDAREYSNFSKKYGNNIMIAENFRYNEENNIIKNLIEQKKIGDIIYFISNYVVNFPQEMIADSFAAKEWRQHPDFPGGRLLDGAIHNLAGLRHIFGAIDSLHAFGSPQEEEYMPYRSANINMQFKSGVIGHFAYFPSGIEAQKPLIGSRIFGTKGMIYLEERSCEVVNVFYNNGGSEQISYKANQGFYNELLNFYKAFVNQEDISVTPDVELWDLKTILAILKSIEEKKVVKVDDNLLEKIKVL